MCKDQQEDLWVQGEIGRKWERYPGQENLRCHSREDGSSEGDRLFYQPPGKYKDIFYKTSLVQNDQSVFWVAVHPVPL